MLFAFVGVCGILLLAGIVYEHVSRQREARAFPPPGQLIDLGRRRLHILSRGDLSPTVVIEQGAGGPSLTWLSIQERLSTFARVCLYDRAGYQWSDPVSGPRTLENRVEDLHLLLKNANVPAPYVLVAHSYGGFLIRLFAKLHPKQVAGLVFIDTPDEQTFLTREILSMYSKFRWLLRTMGLLALVGLPRLLSRTKEPDAVKSAMARREYFKAASEDIGSIQRSASWLLTPDALGSLGDLPIAVVAHGQPFPGPFAVLEKGWIEGQQRLAGLSTDGRYYLAANANHMIHIDAPDIVIEAIEDVVTRARRNLGLQNGLIETNSALIE